MGTPNNSYHKNYHDDDDNENPPLIAKCSKNSKNEYSDDEHEYEKPEPDVLITRMDIVVQPPQRLIELSDSTLAHLEANYTSAIITISVLQTYGK